MRPHSIFVASFNLVCALLCGIAATQTKSRIPLAMTLVCLAMALVVIVNARAR